MRTHHVRVLTWESSSVRWPVAGSIDAGPVDPWHPPITFAQTTKNSSVDGGAGADDAGPPALGGVGPSPAARDVGIAGQRMADEDGVVARIVELAPRFVGDGDLGEHTATFECEGARKREKLAGTRIVAGLEGTGHGETVRPAPAGTDRCRILLLHLRLPSGVATLCDSPPQRCRRLTLRLRDVRKPNSVTPPVDESSIGGDAERNPHVFTEIPDRRPMADRVATRDGYWASCAAAGLPCVGIGWEGGRERPPGSEGHPGSGRYRRRRRDRRRRCG